MNKSIDRTNIGTEDTITLPELGASEERIREIVREEMFHNLRINSTVTVFHDQIRKHEDRDEG